MPGPNGLRTAVIPHAFAARSSGRRYRREHVRVLVGVEVRKCNTGLLNATHLRSRFGFQFV